jgi:hypothetical protein
MAAAHAIATTQKYRSMASAMRALPSTLLPKQKGWIDE